jgi:heme-degrading monooxygenase HmoA
LLEARERSSLDCANLAWRDPGNEGRSVLRFPECEAIPDDRAVPGNLAVYILRRDEGDKTHFLTLTFWESLQAIQGFAGEPAERAKYYPEDRDCLLEFEPKVQHWEIVGSVKP